MPTYGYRCPACSREFDVWQRMSDEPNAACPDCGAAARRLFFPAGIVFKGTGFYATDSRATSSTSSGGEKPKAKAKADGAKPSGTGDAGPTSTAKDSGGTASGTATSSDSTT